MNPRKPKDRFRQAPGVTLQDHLERFRQIERKVGSTPTKRLGWAVSFAQQDLDALMPGEWTDTVAQLRAFCNFPFGRADARVSEYPFASLDEWPRRALIDDDLQNVQRAFRDFLEPLAVSQHSCTGELTIGVEVTLAEDPKHPERSRVLAVAISDNVVTQAMWSLVTLLTAYGDRLKQCPECRQFFVASRTNQEFCAYRCASRKSTRAYRQRQDQPKRGRKGGTTP